MNIIRETDVSSEVWAALKTLREYECDCLDGLYSEIHDLCVTVLVVNQSVYDDWADFNLGDVESDRLLCDAAMRVLSPVFKPEMVHIVVGLEN